MFVEKEEKGISFDKQKEIFYKIVAERTEDIEELHNSFHFQNFIYQCKGSTKDIDFNDFHDAETFFDDINSEKNKI